MIRSSDTDSKLHVRILCYLINNRNICIESYKMMLSAPMDIMGYNHELALGIIKPSILHNLNKSK